MIAISDSSPLIVFSKLGRLDLLSGLFERIVIPPAVYAEVVAVGSGRAGSVEVAGAPWIAVQSLANPEAIPGWLGDLGSGEREAIALAMEVPAPVVLLIDDAAGRRVATRQHIHVMGSAGILVAAKATGLVPSVKPLLDQMLAVGLRLDLLTYHRTLANAGEAP